MPYESGGGHRTARRGPQQTSESDQIMAQIPLLGGWSGARGRIQHEEDLRAEDANRAYWDELNAPSAEQLTADYDTRGADAQMAALDQMAEWGRGGLTATDRAMMDTARARDEQASSAQRLALQQQAQARGMGGSGFDLASQLGADQAQQTRSSDRQTQMMAAAQQRALQAIQQSGQLGAQVRQGDQREAEQGADAVQGAFDAASTRAAGATNQYSADGAARQQGRDRQQDSDDSLLGFLGSL